METPANTAIGKLFYPTAVAVVGASGNLKNLGSRNLKLIKEFGYSGKLYAVNPRAETSFGVPGYRRVVDIPELRELDLNPVMIMEAGSGLSVVDCRMILDRKKA